MAPVPIGGRGKSMLTQALLLVELLRRAVLDLEARVEALEGGTPHRRPRHEIRLDLVDEEAAAIDELGAGLDKALLWDPDEDAL